MHIRTFDIRDKRTGAEIATVQADSALHALDILARRSGFRDHQEAHAANPERSRTLEIRGSDGTRLWP